MAKLMQARMCDGCGFPFEIYDEYKIQYCKECGKPYKPCAVCGTQDKGAFFDGCKSDCPFKVEYAKALAEYNKKRY
jgi:predicted amidophosphoribosyltransferase